MSAFRSIVLRSLSVWNDFMISRLFMMCLLHAAVGIGTHIVEADEAKHELYTLRHPLRAKQYATHKDTQYATLNDTEVTTRTEYGNGNSNSTSEFFFIYNTRLKNITSIDDFSYDLESILGFMIGFCSVNVLGSEDHVVLAFWLFTILNAMFSGILFLLWFVLRPESRMNMEGVTKESFTGDIAPVSCKPCPCDVGKGPCFEAYVMSKCVRLEVFAKATGVSPILVFAAVAVLDSVGMIVISLNVHRRGEFDLVKYYYSPRWLCTFAAVLMQLGAILILIAAISVRMRLRALGRLENPDGKQNVKDCCEAFWCITFCSPCTAAQEIAFLEAVEKTDDAFVNLKRGLKDEWKTVRLYQDYEGW